MQQSSYRKEFRKFKDLDFYNDLENDEFHLLPFNFRRLESNNELLINFLGDFLIVPEGTVQKITKKKKSLIDENLYEDLLSGNFIHDSSEIKNLEFMANRYRTKKSNALGFASLHIFVISLRCEHTCQYCQVSRVSQDKEKYDFNTSDLYKAINLMLASPNQKLTMEFQGGEALLAFDKIKLAVEYTKVKAPLLGKKMTYVICTNLAVVNEEILNYANENNILISTSLDGHRELHNSNRKRPGRNSYELTISGINLSRKIVGYENVSALMTTTTTSLNHPIEIINEYRDQGFNSIFLRPISPYGFAKYNKNSNYHTEEFIEFYKTGLDYIIELNKKGVFFKEIYTSIILKKILTAFSDNYVDLMSPAGLVNSVIVYDYNGKIYVSDEARMLAQMNDETFCVGSVNDSWEEILNSNVINEIAISGVNDYLAGCSSCAYNVYCGADPVHNHATQGDIYGFRPTNSFCKRNMNVIDIIFNKLDTDPEATQIFKSWIKNG